MSMVVSLGVVYPVKLTTPPSPFQVPSRGPGVEVIDSIPSSNFAEYFCFKKFPAPICERRPIVKLEKSGVVEKLFPNGSVGGKSSTRWNLHFLSTNNRCKYRRE